MQRKSLFLLKVSLTVLLLGGLGWRVDWKILSARAEILRWDWALLAIGLGHLDRILMAWKWRLLIQSQEVVVSMKDAVANTYMGNFAGLFLPAGVGGDLVRIFLLRRIHLPVVTTAASVIIERLFGMYALIAMTGLAVCAASVIEVRIPAGLGGWVSFAFVLGTMAILFSLSPLFRKLLEKMRKYFQEFKIFEKVLNILNAYRCYGGQKKILCWFLFLSLVEVCLTTLVFAVSAWSIEIKIHILQFLVVIPLVLFLQRIPISLNGIGIQEGLIVFFLIRLGENLETAVAYSILLRIFQMFIILPGGLLYLKIKNEQPCAQKYQTVDLK